MGPEPAWGARHVQAPSKTDPTDGRSILMLTFSLPWEFGCRAGQPSIHGVQAREIGQEPDERRHHSPAAGRQVFSLRR